MSGNKVIEYIIGAKDTTANAIKSALARVKSFASSVGTNLMNIKAGFDMLASAAEKSMAFLKKAFAFETMTVQFKTLIGNMDEARAHMAMLQELGDTPPFSLEEFAAASRALMVMTDGVLGYKKSLELVGDAAAATGQPISQLAHEVGRAYAIIRDGQPLTRATMALRNMGAISPEVAQRLDDLQSAGASTNEIWAEMEKALQRFSGAMAETEQTGEGLIGAIGAQWDDTLRDFGAACLETAKDGLGAILNYMKGLREDGTIYEWAEGTVGSLHSVANAIKEISGPISYVWKSLKTIGAMPVALVKGLNAADELGLTGNDKMTYARNFQMGVVDEIWGRNEEANADKADRAVARKEERKRKEAEKQAMIEAKAAQEEERKAEALAEGQRKIDERNAAERERAELEAMREQEENERKIQQEIAQAQREIERENARERAAHWREYVAMQRADERALQEEAANAQSRLAAAQANEQQAWGWYRNKDAWKSQLEEERANAAAEKQFEKDAASLQRKTGWRSRTLSDDDEIVRRVLFAREEKQAAEDYARQTAEAAADAAAALERIQEVIEEGE